MTPAWCEHRENTGSDIGQRPLVTWAYMLPTVNLGDNKTAGSANEAIPARRLPCSWMMVVQGQDFYSFKTSFTIISSASRLQLPSTLKNTCFCNRFAVSRPSDLFYFILQCRSSPNRIAIDRAMSPFDRNKLVAPCQVSNYLPISIGRTVTWGIPQAQS